MDTGRADGSMVTGAPLKAYQAQLEAFKVRADAYAATVSVYSHDLDAIRYGVMTNTAPLPAPPPTPPGLTPEQHAAHLMLHDLVSVEEFEKLREVPGFIQLNTFWGAVGKQRYCCEVPVPRPIGEFGVVEGMKFISSSPVMNDTWMAQVEAKATPKPDRPSQWAQLQMWLANKLF